MTDKRRSFSGLYTQRVVQQQRWNVCELTAMVRVMVKHDLVDEHLATAHVCGGGLSQHKHPSTTGTVGFLDAHDQCNLLIGQLSHGAVGQPLTV